MTNKSSKRVVFEQKNRLKCLPSCPRLIYDDPYVFQVRSQRSSARLYPCENCLKIAKQQQISGMNNQYPRRCSRLPPTSFELEQLNRPQTSPGRRKVNDCNWENFMKKKSRYAIQTPYASCNLTVNEQETEDRAPFITYGARYHDKQHGEKRTFNSLAVHQLKHHEVNDERAKSFFREQRLRQQAEKYFREMNQRNPSNDHHFQ